MSGLLLLAAGGLHLWRAFQGWEIMIHTWSVPIWASWVVGGGAVILAGHALFYARAYKY